MDRAELTVGEAAARVGLTAHTLRWYEQVGLIEPVGRDSGGRRCYNAADIDRLVFLTKLRTTGMPVRGMLRHVQLARAGAHTAADRRTMLEAHRQRVLDRVEELRRDLDAIDSKIKRYADGDIL